MIKDILNESWTSCLNYMRNKFPDAEVYLFDDKFCVRTIIGYSIFGVKPNCFKVNITKVDRYRIDKVKLLMIEDYPFL